MNKIRIGIVTDFLISEYSEFIINGVKECGRKMNVDVLVFQAGELNNQSDNFDYQCMAVSSHIRKENLDGVIFISGTQTHFATLERYAEYIKSFNLPVVNIASQIPGIPSVVVKCKDAYTALIEHVIKDCGARKIAVMSVPGQSDEVVEREGVIKQAFDDFNISQESVVWWRSPFSYSGAILALNLYSEKHPEDNFDYDAIFALNDDMALACMDFLRGRGKSVPDDLLVTGFDDMRKAHFNKPALSTVNQIVFEQGYVAARTLLDLITGLDVPMVQEIEGRAVLRQSTNAAKYINRIQNNELIEIDRAALAGVTSESTAAEWYRRRNQLYRVEKCYLDMQSLDNMEKTIAHVTYNLRAFGIPYASIVLYEKPVKTEKVFDYFNLPSKARLLFSYNAKRTESVIVGKEDEYFDPNNGFLPDGIIAFDGNPLVVVALYCGQYQYGYLLVQNTDFDIVVYDILAKSLSNQFARIIKKD